MADRPIIFSGPMVRALLAGTKTQTRRALRDGTWWTPEHGVIRMAPAGRATTGYAEVPCPYGEPGSKLWVRETFAIVPRTAYARSEGVQQTIRPDDPYEHDAAIYREGWDRSTGGSRWRPSIHMPRWASRITLEITGVRVERLQDISEADAVAEGCKEAPMPMACMYSTPEVLRTRYREGYAALWESINGPGSWDANPWVWVVEFRRAASAAQGEKE